VVDKTEGYSGQTWPTCARRLRWVPSELRSLDFDAIDTMEANQVRPIEAVDFVSALRQVKASVSRDDMDTYIKWNTQYGATG